ncbi:PKD domain-containing protein [Halostagnicola sp. A-GB9-2]|uniref:PKD domain-containing protein n=1 Tax=Halostagnicola sp. A-GB9-2 TaxID=3048066 RepID=UPI0024C0C4A1|nr:PKD domain-containing protein [Halostagnicola sp. A-GB9-2]MDJ1434296.1 PKD domain-containing protein [Halostagnicola sp. A-GB9-2]
MAKTAAIVGIAALMILAPMAGVVGAASPSGQTEEIKLQNVDAQSNSEGDEFKISEDVSLWAASPLSLRADLDNAENTIELHDIYLTDQTYGTGPAERDAVGVFDKGEVKLNLADSYGPGIDEYSGEEVNIIIGKLDSDASINNLDAMMALDSDSLSELNKNIEFDMVEEETELPEDGELTDIDPEADDSGQYVAMVSTEDNGEGVKVKDDNLVIEGESTIIGFESFIVQDESSEVETPSSIEPGETIEFEADNINANSENVGHGIALYHEDTFLEQETEIKLTEELDSDFSNEDIIVETSLGAVDGEANLEEDVDLFGFSQDTGDVSGLTDIESVLGLTADRVDFDDDQIESGENILNASATVQENDSDDGTVSIEVETLEDWDEGEYQWIHLAADEDNEELITNEGTITIEEEDDSSSGGGGGGGWAPSDPAEPEASIDITPKTAEVSEEVTFSASGSSISEGEITDYEWEINGETHSGEEVISSFKEAGDYSVELTVTSDEGETDSASTTFTVEAEEEPEPPVPTAAIDVDPDPAEVGEDVTLSAADSSTPEGEITDYEWDVQGETHDGEEMTTSFDEAVEYTVSLTVTNDAGETDSTTATVTVEEAEDDDDDGTPGFGAVSALAALLSIALIGARYKE